MINNTNPNVQRIVILGGGTAGWMTAAALGKLLPQKSFSVTLVESEQIGTVGVGEATLPHLRFFNQRLGINEADFMRATQATFKTGIAFSNWGKQGQGYIHPFGDYGHKIDGIGFHHFWLKQQRNNPENNVSLDQYSLPVIASLKGKFDFPSDNQQDLLSSYSYAYHIDASLYAKYLRDFAEKLAVTRIEGKVVEVVCRPHDQHIEQLILNDGQKITGDFFIDCSGFSARLISKTLNVGYEDWSHWLPCNSAVAIATKSMGNPLPYTKAIAQQAGWQWQIPLQHRIGNGHVYCDKYIDKQQALDTLMANLISEPTSEPNFLSFTTGQRKAAWVKNCLAIGLSSGFLEPLESTSIYLIQSAIMKFIELLPQASNLAIKATEYNRCLDIEMVRIRDFLILHYHVTQRNDTPFWQYCQNMNIPDSLQQKIEMFRQTGHIQHYQYGLFLEPSWLAVYVGQGLIPAHYDGRVDLMSPKHYQPQLELLAKQIAMATDNMPFHHQTIKRFLVDNSINNNATAGMSLYGAKI